jgi:hypothetical protein
LKMNARIYGLPEETPAGKRGPKPKKGQRLISFKEMLTMEPTFRGWPAALRIFS